MKQLSIVEFLDYIAFMPDIEAEGEIIQRREAVKLEFNMLTTLRHDEVVRTGVGKGKNKSKTLVEIGAAISVIGSDLALLNEALKKLRQRMDRTAWREAVLALYGEEGVLQCKLWIIQNDTNPNRPHDIEELLRARGLQPLD
jgi:hypothetical protein